MSADLRRASRNYLFITLACIFIVPLLALSRGILLTPAMLAHLQAAILGTVVHISDLRYTAERGMRQVVERLMQSQTFRTALQDHPRDLRSADAQP